MTRNREAETFRDVLLRQFFFVIVLLFCFGCSVLWTLWLNCWFVVALLLVLLVDRLRCNELVSCVCLCRMPRVSVCRTRSVLSTRFVWDSTVPTVLRSAVCRRCTAGCRCRRCRSARSSRWPWNIVVPRRPCRPAAMTPRCRRPSMTLHHDSDVTDSVRPLLY